MIERTKYEWDKPERPESNNPPFIVTCCILGGILLFFGIVAFAVNSLDPSSGSNSGSGKIGAWVMAQQFVKDRSMSPSTVDFGWQISDDCVKEVGDNVYNVRGWVDSQNGFGAKVRNNFSCKMRYNSNGDWTCENLVISP